MAVAQTDLFEHAVQQSVRVEPAAFEAELASQVLRQCSEAGVVHDRERNAAVYDGLENQFMTKLCFLAVSCPRLQNK